jgi:hypothetical protein
MSAFESDAVWEAVTRFCSPPWAARSAKPDSSRRCPNDLVAPLQLDGHNHGHNLQPTPAYEGLLNRTTEGILPAQAYSSLPERQEARPLKSFGMQVPVGSNFTPSAKNSIVALLSGSGGHNHGHKFLRTTQASLGSMGDTSVGP